MDTEGTNTGWAGAHRGFQTRSAAAWMDGGSQHPPRPALEGLAHVWALFPNTNYRTSVVYVASPVRIDK
jgi:hypothetical protein